MGPSFENPHRCALNVHKKAFSIIPSPILLVHAQIERVQKRWSVHVVCRNSHIKGYKPLAFFTELAMLT